MEKLRQKLNSIRVPGANQRIYKDECVCTFDSPESADGIFVCLNTFLGFGKKFAIFYHEHTGNSVFLNIKRTKIEKTTKAESIENQPQLTRLAIGVEGGYQENKEKYEYTQCESIVILPDFNVIPLPDKDLPDIVHLSVSGILSAESATRLEELAALACTWDGEKRKISKHAENLLQLNNFIKVPSSGWKCEQCDLRENLWFNLTDGSILCGRRFFDGSGGNNHAQEHYDQCKYPLAVKLGTITSTTADVYSYDENDMVEDPYLEKHLAYFGINIGNLKKTDKSMIEIELDYNQRIGEWAIIQESDSKLIGVCGAGYTGMCNLGNSCYLNSVIQVILSIPNFLDFYYPLEPVFRQSLQDPVNDFNVQMAKLAYGLYSGEYSKPVKKLKNESGEEENSIEQVGIKPVMFKNLIGKGHREFSTKRQQDAHEFLLHLIDKVERHTLPTSKPHNPTDSIRFEVEERLECTLTGKVKLYNTRNEYILSLPVPLDKAINKEAVEKYAILKKATPSEKLEVVRSKIELDACFESLCQPELVDDYLYSQYNIRAKLKKTTMLKTFPDYLFVHVAKFTIEDWTPKKLDISLQVPDFIDLKRLRGKGLQEDEELMAPGEPSDASGSASSAPQIHFDEAHLMSLAEVGFSIEACKRALYNTNNSGVERAMDWLLSNTDNPDLNAPFVVPSSKQSGGGFIPDNDALASLLSMSINYDRAIAALKNTNNNLEMAVDWVFKYAGEDLPVEEPSSDDVGSTNRTSRDGKEFYQLVAMISHMGQSTMCGHYVCHILKDGKWVIFNDDKVAISENPPRDLAYIYLFKRVVN